MINSAQFLLDFPEFGAGAKVPAPASGIAFWLSMAKQLLNVQRWGPSAANPWPTPPAAIPDRTLYDLGAELFVAHNLVIEAMALASAKNGVPPGWATGALTSKSVDKVSAGYDASATKEDLGGSWNYTVYGQRYYRLLRMAGAGAIQVNVGASATGLNGPAWPGPYVDNNHG